MSPATLFLLKHLDAPPTGLPTLGTTFAFIAFTQRQDIVPIIATHVRDRFKSLVAALEREVDRPLFEVIKLVVVFNDHGLVAAAGVLTGFNQQIEPLLRRVVGDSLIAAIRMRQSKEPVGLVRQQVVSESADLSTVVKDHEEMSLLHQDAARFPS